LFFQAVIRCIVAYLTEISLDELPYIKIPLHTVIKVTLKNGRNKLEFIKMAIDCVDTYRAKPTNCCTDRDFVAAIASVPFHL
jgi:broad specificity phosphatase PhoE